MLQFCDGLGDFAVCRIRPSAHALNRDPAAVAEPLATPAVTVDHAFDHYCDRVHRLTSPSSVWGRLLLWLKQGLEAAVVCHSIHGDPMVYDARHFGWVPAVEADWRKVRAELDAVMVWRVSRASTSRPVVVRTTACCVCTAPCRCQASLTSAGLLQQIPPLGCRPPSAVDGLSMLAAVQKKCLGELTLDSVMRKVALAASVPAVEGVAKEALGRPSCGLSTIGTIRR